MIGIGNPLRGDDGVGWHLADALGGPHLALHQLTPECAAQLATCGRVLFIDAWLVDGDGDGLAAGQPPGPVLQRLHPAAPRKSAAPALSHHLAPAALLQLTAQLYGRSPEAWQLLIPASAMAHGDTFSPALQALLPQVQALLRRWLEPNGGAVAIEGSGQA